MKDLITEFGRTPERKALKRALFLDRDGVINKDTGYVASVAGFELLAGLEALIPLQNDFRFIVITNQSGIGRGYYSEENLAVIHQHMLGRLKEKSIFIDAIYYCPHHPESEEERYRLVCRCRKPEAGMLLAAIERFGLDPSQSYMIGDKETDMLAGQAAGTKTIHFSHTNPVFKEADFATETFPVLIDWISTHHKKDREDSRSK